MSRTQKLSITSKKALTISVVALILACVSALDFTPTPAEQRQSAHPSQPPQHVPEKDAPPADNFPCYVCHANFEDEPLATRHLKANIGCAACHGESFAHRGDENNTTPPDKMYPRSEIDDSCRQCHSHHDASAREGIKTYLKKCRQISNPEELVCTDCHGNHRMNTRMIHWDKKTGKLLPAGQTGNNPPGPSPSDAARQQADNKPGK